MKEYWLDSLKVGDEVCYYSNWHGHIITKIAKITPTGQIKTEDRKTFKNGICRIDSWTSYSLTPITDEILTELEKKSIAAEMRVIGWLAVPLEKLREIKQILERPKAIETTESA